MPLHPHHGATPEVHPSAWIAPGAHLIGDVYVGENSSIWFGAVLRGDVRPITIGRWSNVQDNSVMHVESPHAGDDGSPCVVGDYVTIGHSCIVHGCRIGSNVLVGMGAVVMNRSVVGADTILGARALVSEDKDIASRSLVIGIPGRVVRELSEQDVAQIRYSAEHYHELAESYRG